MIYGRIYKIYCNKTGECYYGSTEQTLSRRLSKHKQDYKTWKKGESRYVTSFKIIERGNFTISLMEAGEFENKDYMKARERHYIENLECVNKCVPNRSQKEYREANKEKKKEYDEAHKEERKAYREAHKEEKREYDKKNYQANKEKKKQQIKENYQANREQILQKRKQKITCECGCDISDRNIVRHFKSKKHLAYIEQNNI